MNLTPEASAPSAMQPRQPILQLEGITKRFPGVLALDGVGFDLFPSEVHVLLGENGAGKSTLMKILAGVYPADSGRIMLRGESVKIHSPRQAREHGISIIYQEFNLIPELTVAQNIFLGREPRTPMGLVDQERLAAEAKRIEAALPARCRRIVLDERGAAPDTQMLAKRLLVWQGEGDDIAFVIGGPDGLDPSLKQGAHECLRLSSLTLPHGLARVVLAEALYRAYSLHIGHPYHRD